MDARCEHLNNGLVFERCANVKWCVADNAWYKSFIHENKGEMANEHTHTQRTYTCYICAPLNAYCINKYNNVIYARRLYDDTFLLRITRGIDNLACVLYFEGHWSQMAITLPLFKMQS